MSRFCDEDDIRVSGMSRLAVERVADVFLEEFSSDHLEGPGPLDLASIVDGALEDHGVFFYPARRVELPGAEAVTIPDEDGNTNVLIHQQAFDNLFTGGPMARQPRATVAHELGHVVLHAPYVRELRRLPEAQQMLRRASRSDLRSFESAEWQAWIFAGCLLLPRGTIDDMVGQSVTRIARLYGVSTSMFEAHMRSFLRHNGFGVDGLDRLCHASPPASRKHTGRRFRRPG